MNATPPIGTSVAVQLPSDARELMLLARDIANSRLIPSHFQKSPADCFMLMAFCRDKGLNFFATVGHCHVVKNNLFFDGQLSAALLNTSGFLSDRLTYDYERDDKGIAMAVVVSARLRTEATPRFVTVELSKVKTANAIWTSQPEQQLAYSGARIWGRRHLPEVLLGMTFEGETIDVTPTEIKTTTVPAPPLPPANDDQEGPAALGDDAHPFNISRRGTEAADWQAWTATFLAYVRAARTADIINEWSTANAASLELLQRAYPKQHGILIDNVNHQIATRVEQDEAR